MEWRADEIADDLRAIAQAVARVDGEAARRAAAEACLVARHGEAGRALVERAARLAAYLDEHAVELRRLGVLAIDRSDGTPRLRADAGFLAALANALA
jgi:hypothetical protein